MKVWVKYAYMLNKSSLDMSEEIILPLTRGGSRKKIDSGYLKF